MTKKPQKPLVNIVNIKKKGLKSIVLPEKQADDPKFQLGLGDEVTITMVAKVKEISNELNKDLFNFSRIVEVETDYSFIHSVKKAEDIRKEKEEEEMRQAKKQKLI